MRCAMCDKRRKLRGSAYCDQCMEEIWFWNEGPAWEAEMKLRRWAEWPTEMKELASGPAYAAWRVGLVAEYRWDEQQTRDSSLWDAPRPSPASRRARRRQLIERTIF